MVAAEYGSFISSAPAPAIVPADGPPVAVATPHKVSVANARTQTATLLATSDQAVQATTRISSWGTQTDSESHPSALQTLLRSRRRPPHQSRLLVHRALVRMRTRQRLAQPPTASCVAQSLLRLGAA